MKLFVKIYEEKKHMRDSLLVCLVKTMMFKINKVADNRNPKFAPKVINIFIVLDSMSRKTAGFVAEYLAGPALHSIQWVNTKSREYALIVFDQNNIAARLATKIGLILSEINDFNSTVCFNIWFDGTKIPPELHIYAGHREIIGAVSPREMINISEESDESVKSILSDKSVERLK